MDKEYILFTLRQRIEDLKARYRAHVGGVDEFGSALTPGSAAVCRSQVKKELNLCLLIEELVTSVPSQSCFLSDEALEGLERIMEPNERHRKMKIC